MKDRLLPPLLCCLCLVLLPAATLQAAEIHESGLMTYERFLDIRSLDRDDLECRAEHIEPVFNPRVESWERQRTVCEVWIKEKVVPAQRLYYLDGSPVYRTTREWRERVPETRTVERRGQFMVKEDATTETKRTEIKRYVVEEAH